MAKVSSSSSQHPPPKHHRASSKSRKLTFHCQKVRSPTSTKNVNHLNGWYEDTRFKSQQANITQNSSLDVPKIHISSYTDGQGSRIVTDHQSPRSRLPPPRRYSEVSFLKTLLDALPMERTDSVGSADDLSTEGVDGGDDLFAEATPAPTRGGRKISTASLGCLRENLKTSRSYGKMGGNERMQRSRSTSQMMTTAASVEKILFRNRLM